MNIRLPRAPRDATRAWLLPLAVVGALCAPAAVLAHWAFFTGDDTTGTHIPTNANACVPSGCANHSWSFVSGDDVSNTSYPCPKLMSSYDHSQYDGTCGFDFVRYCGIGSAHDGGGLNCHDNDANTNIHAGSSNGGVGTTIAMHGAY